MLYRQKTQRSERWPVLVLGLFTLLTLFLCDKILSVFFWFFFFPFSFVVLRECMGVGIVVNVVNSLRMKRLNPETCAVPRTASC